MHYTKTQGMIAEKYDPRTNPGVFTLKGQYEPGISEVGQREHLSDLDIAEINALYSCRVSSATTPPPPQTVVRQQPSTTSRSTSKGDARLAELEAVEQRLTADESENLCPALLACCESKQRVLSHLHWTRDNSA
ncbi:hypothetical protein FOZ62_008032 [Perkinsus olseni]|uniref:Peptidase M12A domain-containing protein n=2 Tax=Perkinsus olseni TaxID=32597 RepID=A0A7J6SSR6_PEROL|nr:hypothetical protein FOZ62_008032 [Perkinsus olseni]